MRVSSIPGGIDSGGDGGNMLHQVLMEQGPGASSSSGGPEAEAGVMLRSMGHVSGQRMS